MSDNGGSDKLGAVSKIVKYKLEEDCIALRRQRLSHEKIAAELNASGKIPEGEKINKWIVMRFLDSVPGAVKDIVSEDKNRLVQVVNTSMDIVFEVNNLFNKTKMIMEGLEGEFAEKGKVNVYAWKAVVSEMREMLRQMGDIQKEINDYNNVRKFMEIVIETLSQEAPDKVPIIAEKLRAAKGTQWFADILGSGGR